MTFYTVAMNVLLLCSALCIYRIIRGPTAPDRTVIVGFSCLFAIRFDMGFYLTIGITWALVSFIGTIALAKYLEGRPYDE